MKIFGKLDFDILRKIVKRLLAEFFINFDEIKKNVCKNFMKIIEEV